MPFESFSPELRKLIKEKGFIEPTLPQKMGIPEILKGKNVLILAPTSHGKTEAACLGLFDKLYREKSPPISVLYINPLRALSRDLLDRLFWWGDKLGIEIAVRHGDTTKTERSEQSDHPPQCLITTPETLGILLVSKKMREHLRNVRHVIVDEVHEMAGNKRGVHLSLLLERLRNLCGNFQIIGLSATVGRPEKIARTLAPDMKVIRAESEKKYDISVEVPDCDDERAEDLFINKSTLARMLRIRELINKHKSVLAFTNTRQTAEILSSRFTMLDKELKQEVYHGSLSREKRLESEKRFKSQQIKSLISTSSLELGIDIGSIDLVIQYLSPRQVSKLIQRVGRAGHRVGEKSVGIILSGEEDTFESSVIARKAIAKELEDIRIHEGALDVLTMQIIGMTIEEYGVPSKNVFETVRRSYHFSSLTWEAFERLLKFLASMKLVFLDPDGGIKRSRKGFQFHFENLSTIPDTRQLRVVSIVENEPVGNLDEAFVAEHGEVGNTFIVGGRAWKVLQVEESRVLVEPIDDAESAIPAWEGELIPVPFDVAQEVGRMRRKFDAEKYPVDKNAGKEMRSIIKKQETMPTDTEFLVEDYKDFIIIHSCCGTMINDTIARYIAAELTASTGVSVNIKNDPYRIMLQTLAKPSDVIRILGNSSKLKETLELAISQSSLFKYRFLHVARRFGVISKKARFDRLSMSKIISQFHGTPVYEETMREIFVDKMDINGAERILSEIKEGRIKLKYKKGLSHLGELGLVHQFSEVMKPRRPEGEIFKAFRNRLMHTRVRVLCTRCWQYSVMREVRDFDEQPACPKCHSVLIAVTRGRREVDAGKLQKKEKDEMKRSADLMVTYGKKYVLVRAGVGVGIETAARILARLPKDEEQLLKYVYDEEKTFARTKIYWKA
ncbi:MAG: DEAD/DEAH box helicase [Candidatus Aenigmarchaeota archaeon]|nr:DEAD/DEAH box helicase [Candidatus Aenigmarchaeota archaeon]